MRTNGQSNTYCERWRNDVIKTNFLTGLFLLVFAANGFASQINRITLSELHAKADLIVMAEVTKLVEEGNQDHVTIKTELYLKGKSPQTVYTFTLVTRGGLKDFDPSLKEGDSGVFFLKLRKQKGQVEKAYWGSIATFQKNHFDLTGEKTVLKFKHADLDAPFKIGSSSGKVPEKSGLGPVTATVESSTGIDLSTSLEAWRSHRVKRGQAQNIEEYERGFRKGFTDPPGLVDGSADFNLGHSDGMLAKIRMFPNHQDAGDSK